MTKTVLTTGANSGLGLASALEVARRGFRSVGSVRSPEKAKQVAVAAAAAGVDVETVQLDVDDPTRCAAVIDELRPWALINNAGYVDQRRVEDVGDEDARHQLETLVVAPMRLARLCLPHMREQGGGRIVQVSSISGLVTFPMLGWYQAAKHALEAVSDALRMEVAGDGISVSLIEPGAFPSGSAEHEAYTWLRPLQSSAGQVADVIGGALTARVPRARYVVGLDARLNSLSAPFTPTLVRDAALRYFNKL
ncbi:MAG: putative oxidoreductase [Acidimicrobiales bacterium]|nr:putative oxidoreductase [Acidimicrobiales bacterium]